MSISRTGLGGGNATPFMPNLWAPGGVHPDFRSLEGASLDRQAQFAGYNNFQEAMADDGVPYVASLYNQAIALGPLPEDWHGESAKGSVAFNWPREGDNHEQRIFRWAWGAKAHEIPTLYQHMQIQKFDSQANNGNGEWKIFNQWGQNLTFVWNARTQRWETGWDLGDWLRQNASGVASAFQAAMWGLVTLFSLGAATPAALAAAAGQTALYAAAVKANETLWFAIAKGDVAAAIQAAVSFGAAFSKIPNAAEIKNVVPPFLKDLANSPAIQGFAKIFASSGGDPSDFSKLISTAVNFGKQTKIAADEVAKLRDQLVPQQLRPWFDRAFQQGPAAAALRDGIPWYAQGIWDFGAVLGSATGQNVGQRVVYWQSQREFKPWELVSSAQVESTFANQPASWELASNADAVKSHVIPTKGGEKDLLAFCESIRGRYGV